MTNPLDPFDFFFAALVKDTDFAGMNRPKPAAGYEQLAGVQSRHHAAADHPS